MIRHLTLGLYIKPFLTSFILLSLFMGCDDKSVSTLYDKSYTKNSIPCLKLSIYPKDKKMEKTLKKLYPFTQKCEYILLVSYKAGIVCNSNQNAPRKTLSNFPNSYLRMEINRNMNDLRTLLVTLCTDSFMRFFADKADFCRTSLS